MFQKHGEGSSILCPVLGARRPHGDSENHGTWGGGKSRTGGAGSSGCFSQRELHPTLVKSPLVVSERTVES